MSSRASGEGQLLPSGILPKFDPPPLPSPQGRFAVRITLEDQDQSKFPIGAQGVAAIYTGGGGFAALRRIGMRTYSWLNWLYPISFLKRRRSGADLSGDECPPIIAAPVRTLKPAGSLGITPHSNPGADTS